MGLILDTIPGEGIFVPEWDKPCEVAELIDDNYYLLKAPDNAFYELEHDGSMWELRYDYDLRVVGEYTEDEISRA